MAGKLRAVIQTDDDWLLSEIDNPVLASGQSKEIADGFTSDFSSQVLIKIISLYFRREKEVLRRILLKLLSIAYHRLRTRTVWVQGV